MNDLNVPDFGDIKVVRTGTGRTSAPVALAERVTSPVVETLVSPEPVVRRNSGVLGDSSKANLRGGRPWLARFWWLPLVAVLGVSAAVWGHNYYNNRYVGSDYWAQVPATQDTTPVERFSDSGQATGMMGVDYNLTAFNEAGEQRELDFVSYGDDAASMPQPGAFMWLSASRDIVLSQRVVPESEVPAAVLQRLQAHPVGGRLG